MRKPTCILCLLLFVAPAASAQIFKCVAKDGTDLYQNFPCGIDSIGSVATKPQSEKPGLLQTDSKQAKPIAPAGAAVRKANTEGTGPQVGMTMEEVRAIWGEPPNAYYDELVDGRAEIWPYGGSRFVQFDLRGRVSALQR